MLSYSDFLEFVFAGDEAEAGTTIPADVDCTHIVHPADSALAAGDQLAVEGVVHVDQLHSSTDRVLLTQLFQLPFIYYLATEYIPIYTGPCWR